MGDPGAVIAVTLYVAILAFAVAWFLLPSWFGRGKAKQTNTAPDQAGITADEQRSPPTEEQPAIPVADSEWR